MYKTFLKFKLPSSRICINSGLSQGYKLQAWTTEGDSFGRPAAVVTVPPDLLSPLSEQTAVIGNESPQLKWSVGHRSKYLILTAEWILLILLPIDHLKPWTPYNITVLCFTSPGDGVRSDPEFIRTHQDYPGPVSNLRFV